MYIPFNKIIIRTPRFSYQDILEKDVNFLSDKKYIDEAIYIASSDLFDEWHKYKSNQKRIIHDKEKRRISTAVVRYIYIECLLVVHPSDYLPVVLLVV